MPLSEASNSSTPLGLTVVGEQVRMVSVRIELAFGMLVV